MPKFEMLEDISVTSEISDATITARLRRQLDYKPSRFTSGPYWLDLRVGSVHVSHYGVAHDFAHEAAARFLLKHVNGISPRLH